MGNPFGRSVIVPLTNKSGGSVAAGDVVILDSANNDSFTTTTSASVTTPIGIAQQTIASNAIGLVLLGGYAALVNVNASVTRLHYGATFTVAKQATDAGASRVAGTFCVFLTSGTTPDAYVYPVDLAGAALTNPMTTAEDIIKGGTAGAPARLAAGAAGGALSMVNSAVAWNSGTSMPGAKATGDRYWRTDLGLEFYWDGTRWLTTSLFVATMAALNTGSNGTGNVLYADFGSGLDLWLVQMDLTVGVFGTNNGSNFWPYTLDKRAVGDAATTLISKDTSAITASNWVHVTDALGVSVVNATYFRFLIQTGTKTGNPANFQAIGGFTYRLIGT